MNKRMMCLCLGLLLCVTVRADLAPVEDVSAVAETTAEVSHVSSAQVDALVAQNLPEQIQQMQEVISDLRGQLESAHHRLQVLEKQKGVATVAVAPTEPAAAKAAAPKALDTMGEGELYEYALSELQGQAYDGSLRAFERYLAQYPNGKYRANAYYWKGEIYLSKGDAAKATVAFDTVLKDYPLSHKVPGAMLKKAIALSMAGKNTDAKAVYRQLVKQFPTSSAAKLANQQLQSGKQKAI